MPWQKSYKKSLVMETKSDKNRSGRSLTMRSIFRCMMEDGYYPTFEETHIQFGMDDNIAVVEYEEGILAVRLFFSIEEEAYDLFLEASNSMMMYNYSVKSVILDDMKNIMFGCEIPCDNVREFRKFFPRCIQLLQEGLRAHKSEMRRMILADQVASKAIPAADESQLTTIRPKIVS